MTTLGFTNFGSLTAPIQPLSDFDNILGNQSSATQGAGCIGYNPAVPGGYQAGSVGAALFGLVGGGSTAGRPAVPILYQSYVDTTLGFPIWCLQVSPALWIDAAGVIV